MDLLARFRALVTATSADLNTACTDDCAACPAHVGSVSPHSAHVLVRAPPPAGAAPGATAEAWWPEKVDDEPGVAAVAAVAKAAAAAGRLAGGVKVTAFDHAAGGAESAADADAAAAAGGYELLVFPAGVHYRGLALEEVAPAALAALGASDSADAGADGAAALAARRAALPRRALLVCVHRARDARCGALGPPLAAALRAAGAPAVFLSSHVGGHAFAGNVIVYRRTVDDGADGADGASDDDAAADADGAASAAAVVDWFGMLKAADAGAFYAALAALPPASEAAADPALRRWWRGRAGLGKAEQKALWRACAGGARDIEEASAA
jgi:hypothetical protein